MRGFDKIQAARIAGYALTLVYFGLFTGRVNLLFYGEGAGDVFPAYAHAAEVGQFCCLFLAGFAAWRRPAQVERFVLPVTLVLLVGGYALTLYQAVGASSGMLLGTLAGGLFGAGQGGSFLGWFLIYSRMHFRDAARDMAMSTVLSAVLLLIIGWLPSTVVLFSALSIVVALNCSLLAYCRVSAPTIPIAGACATCSAASQDAARWLRSWLFLERRSLLCLLALAFVCGAQRVVSLEGFLPQGIAAGIFALGYAVGAVAFAVALKAGGDDNGYFRMYMILLAVMATCGVLSFVQSAVVQTLLYAVDNISFTVVSMCMVMMAVGASRTAPISPLVLGGLVCGTMYFAIQAGRIVCNVVERALGMDVIGGLVVSVIIIYVVALAALSSGAFVRQVTGTRAGGAPSSACAVGNGTQRTVISIANVTEDRLRQNPVYRERFGFTDRELDTVVLLLAGYNAADIGELLGVSVNTIKTHLKNVYAKAGVHSRRDLIALLNAVEYGGIS